jgi:hypothetical protein
MRKTIFAAAAAAAAGALMMLGAAVPASAQPARAAIHGGVTQSSVTPCTPPTVSTNAKQKADKRYRVEAVITSNPGGCPVEAAASCYSTQTAHRNIYGTAVYKDGAESFAVCSGDQYIYFEHGGYRYEAEFNVWVYHTYLHTCGYHDCF